MANIPVQTATRKSMGRGRGSRFHSAFSAKRVSYTTEYARMELIERQWLVKDVELLKRR